MSNEKTPSRFFVYCYLDPRVPGEFIYDDLKLDYKPIYIGKGTGRRYKTHLYIYKNNNTRFYSKLTAIFNDGYKPICIIVKNNLLEDESFYYEKHYINLIGRIENAGPLTNLSDGGEGQSGFKMSDETKLKMSEARKGEKNYMFGKKHSESTKLKISKAKMGSKTHNRGKTMEEYMGVERAKEVKQILSDLGKKRTGENHNMFGRKHTEESKLKMSKNTYRRYGSDNPSFGRVRKDNELVYDTWELTNENGDIFIIDNLNKFCRENNLNATCMRDIFYGRLKKYKNWIKVKKLTNNVKKKKPD
jgi:group I intron endonuclease